MYSFSTYFKSIRFGVFLITFSWILSPTLSAQEAGNKQLDEVKVTGFAPEKYMAGLKVQKVDSVTLARFQFQTMADFLAFQSPISLKGYGPGQLTTLSFRGTSANHTALLWNGININAPTVGQTDYSTVPLLGFDEMAIQYGSAASCVGTDAIGGSILLGSAPRWKQKGFNATVGGQYNTLDNFNGQAGIRFVEKLKNNFQLSGKTLLYGSQYNNHYNQTSRTDSEGRTYPVEPSETVQKGLVQDLFLRNKNGNQLSLNIWLTDSKLTIQPDVVAFREITQTKAYRFLGGYQLKNTTFKAGFIRDIIDYGTGDFSNPSHSETDRYIVRAEHEFSWKKADSFWQTNLRIGGEFVHYAARVDGYGDMTINEDREDVFALLRQQFSPKLFASVNLRQAFSSKYKAPFTPSFGLEYLALSKPATQVKFTGNIARSYRLPTLNERYWKVLGNPDIRPESGFNKEIGTEIKQLFSENLNATLGVNAYHNLIDDWTYWNPDKNYRVENLQQVLTKGLEVTLALKYLKENKMAGITGTYAYTNASQQKVYDAYAADIIGKQLIYVPVHTLSGNAYAGKGDWSLNIQGLYNSDRFITFDHSGRPFPPYFLLNSTVSGKIQLGRIQSSLILQVNNLTDIVYPSVRKNAMPGRSFSLGLVFNFNS